MRILASRQRVKKSSKRTHWVVSECVPFRKLASHGLAAHAQDCRKLL
jgi:hypothetical protein